MVGSARPSETTPTVVEPRLRRIALALIEVAGHLMLVLAPSSSMAQTTPAARRAFRLTLENDLIALRGAGAPPDYDYTHGTRLALSWASAPRWLSDLTRTRPGCGDRDVRRDACLTTSIELAQEIYTPRRDAPTAVPGERPYAGWLYARVRAHLVRAHRIRRLGATFGIIGPPSLAEQMQRSIHRLLGNAPQVGWADQLHTEPGITVSYDERTALVRPAAGSVELEWGGVAGNVRTAAHAGVLARVHLGGAMPWSPGEPDIVRLARFHGLVAWRQDVVPHDLFVDGSTFRDSPRADRRPLVNQLEVGVGYRRRRHAIDYRHVRRGREYRAQPGAHAYGAIGVSVWW